MTRKQSSIQLNPNSTPDKISLKIQFCATNTKNLQKMSNSAIERMRKETLQDLQSTSKHQSYSSK